MVTMNRADLSTGIEILNNRYMIDAFPFESVTKINIIENENVIINYIVTNSIGQLVSGGFGNEGIQNKKVLFIVRITSYYKGCHKTFFRCLFI